MQLINAYRLNFYHHNLMFFRLKKLRLMYWTKAQRLSYEKVHSQLLLLGLGYLDWLRIRKPIKVCFSFEAIGSF